MLTSQHLAALALGYALDLVVGDPHGIPHPVRWMGRLISALEPPLRAAFPKTDKGEFAAGAVLAIVVPLVSWAVAAAVVVLATRVNPWLGLAVESVVCCQMLATKSLRDESMRVHDALAAGDLPAARKAVSMIVGRDTQGLDVAGVTRAAVETVAENSSDGVVAPLLYMALGGAPLGVLYKAVNTMDSMVGYKNDRMDDVLNFVPARVSGALMCAGAALAGFDGRGAWRIMRRDHAKHLSPNSAYTEAACAGALGVRLAGDNYYFGKLVHKPTLGDATRPVEPADIARANRLLYATSLLGFALSLAMGWALGTLVEVPLWL